jgi:glycosyltransferase involved in cell wall biosynthesis
MRPISVLLTNNTLSSRGGSETYVRDVALALQRRGHRPVAFSLALGSVAAELRRATIPVLDDLTRLAEPPDVIHGHHHLETLIATLAFPGTPVVNFCHGWLPWEEMPLHHPSVRRYVAVDEVCVDRLVREEGIPGSRVELLLNFVDFERFRPRPPLPPRPRRALILSNYATAEGYARAIIAACEAAGIETDIVGLTAGNPSDAPETLVPAYDLVFAKGRTALEALAVGCAVVPADFIGAGPLVTPENYARLRTCNFGIRTLTHAHDPGWYGSQIAQYCPLAAADVSAHVRAEAGIDQAIDRLIEIYSAAMTSPPGPGDASRAAAIHCARIARPLKEAAAAEHRSGRLTKELESARAEIEASSRSVSALQRQLLAAAQECEHRLAAVRGQVHALQHQVVAFRALPTLRLRDALLRTPVVGPLLQAIARRLARRL